MSLCALDVPHACVHHACVCVCAGVKAVNRIHVQRRSRTNWCSFILTGFVCSLASVHLCRSGWVAVGEWQKNTGFTKDVEQTEVF